MSMRKKRQNFLRYYRDQTGEKEIDMHKVAAFAKAKGFPMPKPPSDVDLLARHFADDAQAEEKIDETTGRPYRVYQALPVSGQLNMFHYIDIDEATRMQMHKSANNRREGMVSDGLKLSRDLDHWNRAHADQEQIELPWDLTFDIELRKAAEDQDKAA